MFELFGVAVLGVVVGMLAGYRAGFIAGRRKAGDFVTASAEVTKENA